jgi:3,4-dihydroxy-9,10-secoandrosta-1,3,5(10)-triene-9,17-dione 4,5-dioxygenase
VRSGSRSGDRIDFEDVTQVKIRELGYLIVGTTDLSRWQDFGAQMLGAQVLPGPEDTLRLKIDERACRLIVRRGTQDALTSSGWMVEGREEFQAAVHDLEAARVTLRRGASIECAVRAVTEFVSFDDPSGQVHEIAWGPISDFVPFGSPIGVSGFVTGALGMGHVVLTAVEQFDATVEFMTKVCGFNLADILHLPLPGLPKPARVYFYHCNNARQHSYALAELPGPASCNHILLQVAAMDDVGRGYDRASYKGVPLVTTLGRHVNDEMFSFYMKSPGGFDVEYGYGGKTIEDWSKNVVFETTRGSHWGHIHLPVGNK